MPGPLGDPSLVEFFISERARESNQESTRIGLESEARPAPVAPARSHLGSGTGALRRLIGHALVRRSPDAVA
jgi:hypothetical protein